jgi:hypothetical protein
MNKIFNRRLGGLLLLSTLFSSTLLAQDSEITSQDLRKYALLNEVINMMKKDLSAEVNGMIKNQEGMTGKRYKELASTKGDEAKLTEIEAKDYEIKFLELVSNLKDERTKAIKLVNQELATKMVGNRGKTYKSIKAELKSNEELKSQYDEIVVSLQGSGSSD